MKFIHNEVVKLIEEKDDIVLIDTEECDRYQKNNKFSCLGCRSNLGCGKYIKIKEIFSFSLKKEKDIKKIISHVINVRNGKKLKGIKY